MDLAVLTRSSAAKQASNFIVALGFVVIVGIMLAYVPPLMMSSLLVIDIAISLMILMMALYMIDPLEFSTFPTVLLFMTMYRLSLNVASTKLILTPATGTVSDKAGAVIEFFGSVVAGNNAIIGFIVFLILVIIQFVVITKGSGR